MLLIAILVARSPKLVWGTSSVMPCSSSFRGIRASLDPGRFTRAMLDAGGIGGPATRSSAMSLFDRDREPGALQVRWKAPDKRSALGYGNIGIGDN